MTNLEQQTRIEELVETSLTFKQTKARNKNNSQMLWIVVRIKKSVTYYWHCRLAKDIVPFDIVINMPSEQTTPRSTLSHFL